MNKTQQYDYALLKIWFANRESSRNFRHVTWLIWEDGALFVMNGKWILAILNWANVTMIEEINE
jgi:hypothetical protein